MSEDDIRRLIDNLSDSDEDVGMNAIDRLTALGAAAVEPLLAVVADRKEAKDNPSILRFPRNWPEAVLVLGKIRDARAVEPLLAAFRDLAARDWPNGWSSRSALVDALGRIGDPRALAVLEDVAANDPVNSIRGDAAEYVKKIRSAK